MDSFRTDLMEELAALAARLVVEDGMEYGPAKRQAGKRLGVSVRGPWPDNDVLEAAVREHIALFCADTQPQELRALRELAVQWMQRLSAFSPHVSGAVWHGTATRHSDIYMQLFCQDPKAAELLLLDQSVNYHPGSLPGWRGETVPVLTLQLRCKGLDQPALLHLMVYDQDGLRGALKPDAQGRKPRGDAAALQALLYAPGVSTEGAP